MIYVFLATFDPQLATSIRYIMLKNLFLTRRFFLVFGAVIVLFIVSYSFGWLMAVAQTALVVVGGIVLADFFLLFNAKTRVSALRRTPRLMSLGDANRIFLDIDNRSLHRLRLNVVDEIPMQFQKRDFDMSLSFAAGEARRTYYDLTPTERGAYNFGSINLFATSFLGLVERRFVSEAEEIVPVYPSVIQMKNCELKAFRQISHQTGIKKIRRLGHSYEFEQIKNYVAGDDFRTINWKAASRRATLMVNQYEDERSQQVYCVIDKSRVMRMPFGGLTLMDHAINAALVMSNIVLKKKDKAGLLSFSDKIGSTLAADNSPNQLGKILNELYREKEGKGEASYELLYYAARQLIKGRSLLLLFTNFESQFALDRVLPTLRLLNNLHLLVVVFFVNTEIEDFAKGEANTTEDIFHQTIAQKFRDDKTQMVQKLRQYGIQSILTRPEDLNINTINKYLELKSRGFI
ncbi:MAG: DUF58 domain-containing protein [Saprospiraceae bacterium]|nr:DUF58 domain-containing protein [Saprospiraceae bacterium]